MSSQQIHLKSKTRDGRSIRVDDCDVHLGNFLFGAPLLMPRKTTLARKQIRTKALEIIQSPGPEPKARSKVKSTSNNIDRVTTTNTKKNARKTKRPEKTVSFSKTVTAAANDITASELKCLKKTSRRPQKARMEKHADSDADSITSDDLAPLLKARKPTPPRSDSSSSSSSSLNISASSSPDLASRLASLLKIRAAGSDHKPDTNTADGGAALGHYPEWQVREDFILRNMKVAGETHADIGKALGRGKKDVERRWKEMRKAGDTGPQAKKDDADGGDYGNEIGIGETKDSPAKEAKTASPPKASSPAKESVFANAEDMPTFEDLYKHIYSPSRVREGVEDSQLLGVLSKRYNVTRLMHLQADYYNMTGKLVSLGELSKRLGEDEA